MLEFWSFKIPLTQLILTWLPVLMALLGRFRMDYVGGLYMGKWRSRWGKIVSFSKST